MRRLRINIPAETILMLVALTIIMSCAHDVHRERAATIKDHVDAFYDHLMHDRIAAAIHENEEIEAIATQLGSTVTRRVTQPGTNRIDRNWTDLKTANETAAQNWLALGQYLAIKKQYPQARATYRRIIASYTGEMERPYRDQAQRALQDLDILDASSPPK